MRERWVLGIPGAVIALAALLVLLRGLPEKGRARSRKSTRASRPPEVPTP